MWLRASCKTPMTYPSHLINFFFIIYTDNFTARKVTAVSFFWLSHAIHPMNNTTVTDLHHLYCYWFLFSTFRWPNMQHIKSYRLLLFSDVSCHLLAHNPLFFLHYSQKEIVSIPQWSVTWKTLTAGTFYDTHAMTDSRMCDETTCLTASSLTEMSQLHSDCMM